MLILMDMGMLSYDVKNDSVIDINNPLNVVLEPKYKEETKKED